MEENKFEVRNVISGEVVARLNEYDINMLSLYMLIRQNNQKPQVPADYKRISDILHYMGVPSNLQGYQYVKEAILIAIKSDYILNMTKEIYPNIAEKFSTYSIRVERSIRNIISATWKKGNRQAICEIFGSEKFLTSKPTNSEFIFHIADMIKTNSVRYF